jgi:curli biogenesis system outer membrane secretion channel CsgG
MKGMSIAYPLLAATLVAVPAQAQDNRPVSRPTIAVVAFDTTRTGWMPPPGFGETVADLLTDRLVSGGAFRIIDTSLVVLPGDDVGRMPAAMLMERAASAGVHYLVLGAVTRLSMEHRTSTGGGVVPIPIVGGLIKKKKTDSILGLTIRMVDTRTGEIITTTTVEGSSSGNTSSGGGVAAFLHLPFVAGKHSSASGIQDGLLANAVGEAVAGVAAHLSTVAPRLAPAVPGSTVPGTVPRSLFWFGPPYTYMP